MGDLTERGHGVPVSHPQIGVTVCPPHPQKWGGGGGGHPVAVGGGCSSVLAPHPPPAFPAAAALMVITSLSSTDVAPSAVQTRPCCGAVTSVSLSSCPQLCPDLQSALCSGSPSLHHFRVSSAPSRAIIAISCSLKVWMRAAVTNTWPVVTVATVVMLSQHTAAFAASPAFLFPILV